MKLQGSLKDLVKVGDNKRDQLPPPSRLSQSQKPTAAPGRKRASAEDTVFVPTRLLLPEELKMDLDRLFLDHKKELPGKNQFMVEAIRDAIGAFRNKKVPQ